MSTRTITGNLPADPEQITVGSIQITKFRVIENTGDYWRGEWVAHDTPTTHFVEARFELGQNALGSLNKGDAVIVIGAEHTKSWGDDTNRQYGRVLQAHHIGLDLARAKSGTTITTPN
ncbi:single-stranded DNA-binding protein [Herbiconiux ginsengi]|uniref:Single-strand DNA-binding protein n=1 Tax=Herbiconiux ginsengi TaxID=381665 RepID=A0A1H3TDD8_9MICO|nr:single-stranded DNA-binding protein [Herbiconiux ginsengi]SDZ48313.1 single-strand DNA-binding protein [Herbiconiux ginsengi]